MTRLRVHDAGIVRAPMSGTVEAQIGPRFLTGTSIPPHGVYRRPGASRRVSTLHLSRKTVHQFAG